MGHLHIQRGGWRAPPARGRERVRALISQALPLHPLCRETQLVAGVAPAALGPKELGLPFPGSELEQDSGSPAVPTGRMTVAGVMVYVLASQAVLGHRIVRPPSSQG